MSDYDRRNQAFDYAPPARNGSGYGALLLVGGIVALFILGMVLLSPSVGTVLPEDAAPVAPLVGTQGVEPLGTAVPAE